MDEQSQFELAVDAVVEGDIDQLTALLHDNPALIDMRSTRDHRAALIHYIGANGVENYRQRSPQNAVAVLQVLLQAGADVNAVADMYHGSTTLGLVATSVHPTRAGVMFPLLTALLQAGADIDFPGAGGNGQTALVGSLHNGRPESADFLARHGAQLDLEGACGTGRLDVVKTFFNDDNSLKSTATIHQMEMGFIWACVYGYFTVVEYLMQKGIDINKQIDGSYGLHSAIIGAWQDIISLLLKNNASLETVNDYGGTALGCALWTIANRYKMDTWPKRTIDDVRTFEQILEAGAYVEPGMADWLRKQNNVDPVVKERVEALLDRYQS